MTAAVEDSGDRLPRPLPEPVRQRVVTLAAEALGLMPQEHLPPSLKRVATFAPGRRAKLAGSQIAGVIESDDTFREHLARQVRTLVAPIAEALDAGAPPAAADPVEVAAVAYLLRPEGWADLVAASAGVAAAEREVEESRRSAGHLERLRRQLDSAAEEIRELRARNREEVARLKAENTELRHKLGDVRARLRTAEAEVEAAQDRAADAGRAATAASAAADAEVRRLRARIEELEGELTSVRRTERSDRGTETLRARLLLDTLLDTAQGLRRELALPAVEGSPADQVEAHVAEQGSRTSTGHGSMAVDDPALLEQLLALPRVHMVIDGYNVTKTAWPDLSLEKQRDRLMGALAPLVARSGAEVTVVFDAADKKERPLVNRPRGVRVLFSPVGVIADDVIRELVAAEPQGRPVVVVTTDQAVVRDVTKAGARAVASAALARLLSRG